MSTEIQDLIKYMRKLNAQVVLLETLGGLIRMPEVGPQSFVQILECTKMPSGGYRWTFHQTWVEKMTPSDQKAISGAYQNDFIGNHKIIGIFDPVPGLEMVLPK